MITVWDCDMSFRSSDELNYFVIKGGAYAVCYDRRPYCYWIPGDYDTQGV